MNIKKICCILLALTAILSMFLIKSSVAWLETGSGEEFSQNITVNKMLFEFNGSLGSALQYEENETVGDSFILPDQNLIIDNGGKITGVNYSTIATDVRVLITYDTTTDTGAEYTGAATPLSVTFASGWTKGVTDNFYYNSFNPVSGDSDNFDIISDIHYDVDKTYSSRAVSVSVVIQAKQHDYVNWTTISTIIGS